MTIKGNIATHAYRPKRPSRKRKQDQPSIITGSIIVRVTKENSPSSMAQSTIIRKQSAVPDMTPEEHKRRGDAADALFRDIVRAVAAKNRDK